MGVFFFFFSRMQFVEGIFCGEVEDVPDNAVAGTTTTNLWSGKS
jgi:hypothetical protein